MKTDYHPFQINTNFIPIAIVLLLSNVFAQKLYSQKLIEENKIWAIVDYKPFEPDMSTYIYRFFGDTTINDREYKILQWSDEPFSVDNWTNTDRYLREDSIDRVYMLDNDEEEFLLYDFNLQINDTFDTKYPEECRLVVQQIDSITLLNGERRKRISLVNSNDPDPSQPWYGYNHWVEGIGSLLSLTDQMGVCYTDFGLALLCFMENGEYLYRLPTQNSCFITNADNIEIEQVKLYPNPINDLIHIETDQKIHSIKLFDLLGNNIKINISGRTVDIKTANSGIHILHIEFNDGQIINKVVVKQ